jgi:acetyl esterase/lipase
MQHGAQMPMTRLRNWLSPLVIALFFMSLSSCRLTSLPLWGPVEPPSADAYQVEKVPDLVYYDGPERNSFCHSLDLYLPKGKKDYPVVVLVHGGAWMLGDNRCCGLYSTVGEFLASRGVGAVLPNYRLSPWVKHPEHVKDLARVVAWTRAHIAGYGASPAKLFLAGHSAGGHLVSLLATDETYLKAEGMQTADIRGVITLSGVYRIPDGNMQFTFGGDTPLAFRFNEVAPVRGDTGPKWASLAMLPGIPMSLNVFGPAFGNDSLVRESASPLSHVRPGLPPFLIFSAEQELPTLA